MSKSIVPSITALELAIDVLARAAAREASASAGIGVLFGADQHVLKTKLQEKAFDLHQVVEFLQGQVDVRHPVSLQKEQDVEEYDTLVVTLRWKDGVCPPYKTAVWTFSRLEVENSLDPGVKKWVYWAERALHEFNDHTGRNMKLKDVRRSTVGKRKLAYNPSEQ
jgi:hypothetical protein